MWGLFVKYKSDKARTWVGRAGGAAVGDLDKVTGYLAANHGLMRNLGAKDFRIRRLTSYERAAIVSGNTY